MSNRTLWSKDFIVAVFLNLFMMMVFYLLMTSMAGYAVARFTAGDAAAGFASSSFVVASVVGRVFTGKYLDFVGRRRMLMISMLVFVLASCAYFVADTLWLLVAVRLLHGLAHGTGNTAIMTAIQSIIPASRRAEGTGYVSTAVALATSLGPFLGVFLPERFDFTMLFAASACFSLVTLVLTVIISLPEICPTEEQRRVKWQLKLHTFADPVGMKIGTIMAVAGIAYTASLVFLAGYADHNGIAQAASWFFVSYALASLVSRLVIGRIQDARGDNIVIYPVLVSFALGNIVIATTPTVWGLTIAGVLIGVGFGSLLPCAQAIVVMNVAPERVPVATSSFFLLLDTGTGIGPVILGAAISVVHESGIYLLSAGLVVTAIVLYYLVHGRPMLVASSTQANTLNTATGRDTVT